MMMKKRVKYVIGTLFMMGTLTMVSPVVSVQDIVIASEVEPRTDILEWRYKVIDGHFYKRLFNRSTGEWETDWILVQ